MPSPAVFLDRDGVINRDRADFVKSWEEFEFLPHSLDALAALARTPYKIVVVSNQSGVGRGLLSEATLQHMHAQMLARIRESGGRIDAIYYCPHAPDAGCDCRKPSPGLFLQAARDMNLDLASSWSIGDSHRDAQAAHRAGVRSILIDRSLPDPTAVPDPPLDFHRATDLPAAVRIVLDNASAGPPETPPV
jgi:histidinol-phosphate phosphatase family protein